MEDIFLDFQQKFLSLCDTIAIKKTHKSSGSITELLNIPHFSYHNITIQIGQNFEIAYRYIAKKYAIYLEDTKNIPYQVDILFEKNKKIYYFESKLSLQFDSEKRIKIINKLKDIENILKKHYKDKEVICKILTSRYITSTEVKYSKIDKNLIYGYGDFFNLFDRKISENEWQKMFDKLSSVIIKKITEYKF